MTDFAGFFSISKMQRTSEHCYRSNIKISSSISLWEQTPFYSTETKIQEIYNFTALQAIAIY